MKSREILLRPSARQRTVAPLQCSLRMLRVKCAESDSDRNCFNRKTMSSITSRRRPFRQCKRSPKDSKGQVQRHQSVAGERPWSSAPTPAPWRLRLTRPRPPPLPGHIPAPFSSRPRRHQGQAQCWRHRRCKACSAGAKARSAASVCAISL